MNGTVKTIGAVVGLLSCGALGFGWRDLSQGQVPDPRAAGKLLGVKSAPTASPEQTFRTAYNQIRHGYTRTVDGEDLKYAGMQGLMGSLGDPHTVFMPPRAAQQFSEQTSANFFGVGAKLAPDPLGAKAVTVFDDGPAFKSGLKKNDLIIAVDGKKVAGKVIDDIVTQIKGKEGTLVTLTVVRAGSEKPLTISIKRGRIITPTVESEYLADSQVGYMLVSQFSQPTATQFDREVARRETKPLKGLVVDLRGNPGGLLETAQEMLGRFVENKVVVKMKGRAGLEETVRTPEGERRAFSYPIVVLIDESSASAAEIFAGCLRDYGMATLVGTHSYGKASVQNVFPLIDRSSAKVTIANYYLPSGEFIGRKVDEDGVYVSGGLIPSVNVELDTTGEIEFGNPAKDNQLAKAIEIVLGMPGKTAFLDSSLNRSQTVAPGAWS